MFDEQPDGDPHGECAHEIHRLEAEKDAAYLERNRLVALLATLYPSGRGRTAIEGWSEDWHNCVYIDFPWGQASWHYHDSHAYLFAGLRRYQGNWDGHTTEQKYGRILAFTLDQIAARSALSAAGREAPDHD